MPTAPGHPCLYWYPHPSAGLRVLSLGEVLSDLQEVPVTVAAEVVAGGRWSRVVHRQGWRIVLVLERFGSVAGSAVERGLVALEAHLRAGGLVGVSRRHDRMWAAQMGASVAAGDVVVPTSGNGFTGWSTSAALAAGDQVVIESPDPDGRREVAIVDAVGLGRRVTLSEGTIYPWAPGSFVRHRDCYPVCHAPIEAHGGPIVVSDYRRTWTLRLTLEYSLDATLALWGQGGLSSTALTAPSMRGELPGPGTTLAPPATYAGWWLGPYAGVR